MKKIILLNMRLFAVGRCPIYMGCRAFGEGKAADEAAYVCRGLPSTHE